MDTFDTQLEQAHGWNADRPGIGDVLAAGRELRSATMAGYQDAASRWANMDATDKEDRILCALGLAGETGEVVDLIKKFEGHGHDVDVEKLKLELGDLLWYLARLASKYGIPLEEIARANVAKLEARYPNGFSKEASRNRTK